MAVLYSRDGVVARVELDRPEVLNAADEAWVAELDAAAARAAIDDGVRVVVVSGRGSSFSTGIDLTALDQGRIGREWFVAWERALRRFETMDRLVVAAVHGYCIGGGLQVALACDLRIARADAILGLPAVKECLIPGLGTYRLPRFIGLGRARRMILTGETIGAEEALRIGLVDRVAPAGSFEAELEQLTEELCGVAFASAVESKRLVARAFEDDYEGVLAEYLDAQGRSMGSPEHAAAMAEWSARRTARRRA
jgi:enoyl-CoA hydratase/carnithine racemase